ncbi:tolloid-like protein 2 [Uloborus diversus]|uniref:tolloid-like protein 2 n=1 Tax=Uloborus diversus TaxID=327109 RepID=UPI00240A8999|nr:tolloid-like protein 2 [Uloborus diversus]
MEYQSMGYLLLIFCLSALYERVSPVGSFQDYLQEQNLEKTAAFDCDLTIRSQNAFIRSPGYPGKYPRYTRCEYVVQKFAENVCDVQLTFEWFDVARMYFSNCSADFFEVQDRENRKKICGELRSGYTRVVSFPENSDRLIFRFQSTFHQKRGFSIQVIQYRNSCRKRNIKPHSKSAPHVFRVAVTPPAPPSCDKVIDSRIGRLSFQEGKGADSKTCTYRIRKSEPRACVVQLDFAAFDVYRSLDCTTDYLLIPSGRRLCGTLGGSRKTFQYPAGQNEIVITFTSTKGNLNSFDIQVVQLPGPCDNFLGLNATGTYDQNLTLNANATEIHDNKDELNTIEKFDSHLLTT